MPLEAYETLQEIRQGIATMEFASLPAIVKTAQNLSRQVETMTNFELAKIISKDPFATAKVLDLANKGGRDKVSVTKLEDAILAAGYSKVRQIAFALLDMESVKEKLRHPEQEEAASIGLVSCLIAEELMALSGNYEAEEAFISTVLRSYGKVLMASFLIETYREAMMIIPMKGEKGAFRAAFGLTPVELTYELLSDSKLPKEIIRTLKPLDPAVLEAELITLSKTDELLIFAEFSSELTNLIFNRRLGVDKFDDALIEQIERYKLRFQVNTGQIYDVMARVDGDLQALEEQYDISPVPEVVLQTISARAAGEDPPKEFVGSKKLTEADRKKMPPEDIIRSGINSVMSICSKKDINVSKIQAAIVKTLHSALKLNDIILFEKDDDDKKVTYLPILGEGEMFKHVKKRTKLSPLNKDLFNIILSNNCDALVFDAGKANVKPLIPHWASIDNVNSMFIYMFHEMDPPFVVVCMRNDGTTIQLTGQVMKALNTLRVEAMKSRIAEPDEKAYALNFKTFLQTLKAKSST